MRLNGENIDGECYRTYDLDEGDQIDILATKISSYGYMALEGGFKLKSLSDNLLLLDIKSCQSFLSLSEIFLFNYIWVSINSQFGLFDLGSFENFHVSKTFQTFSGSPDKILLSLSFTQDIISLT